MTREGFSDFIHAAEHSSELRRKVIACSVEDPNDLLELAAKYGFSISLSDLKREEEAEKIENWFELSKINPIKKSHL